MMMSLGNQILLRLKMAKNPTHIIITKDEKELATAFDKEVNWIIVIYFIGAMATGVGAATIMHISDYHKYNSEMALQHKAYLADLESSVLTTIDQGPPAIYDFYPHPCSENAGFGDGKKEIEATLDRSACFIRRSPP